MWWKTLKSNRFIGNTNTEFWVEQVLCFQVQNEWHERNRKLINSNKTEITLYANITEAAPGLFLHQTPLTFLSFNVNSISPFHLIRLCLYFCISASLHATLHLLAFLHLSPDPHTPSPTPSSSSCLPRVTSHPPACVPLLVIMEIICWSQLWNPTRDVHIK